MLVNKTQYLFRIRNTRNSLKSFINVNNIRFNLEKIDENLEGFKNKLSKSLLPSFISKEKQKNDLSILKDHINKDIEITDKEIKEFGCVDQKITVTVQKYFFNELRKSVLKFRNIERDHLNRTDLYSNYQNTLLPEQDESMMETIISTKTNIRKSIFNLTNTLLELKMVLKDQSQTLDKIDHFFDETNFYLKNANKEISKIPKNYTKFKDLIIYFLIYVICVLLILVLVKQMKFNK